MLMMLKDILKTLAFSLIPAFIFAFLVILAIPLFQKSGIKKVFKIFFEDIKENKENLYLLFFLMYIFIVFYKTVLQRDFIYSPLENVFGGWKIFMTQYTGLDHQVIGNILMFIPFSLFYCLMKKTQSVKYLLLLSILFSFLYSLLIELNQLIFSKGTFQLSDIVYNTLGGLIGALIYLVVKLIINKIKEKGAK